MDEKNNQVDLEYYDLKGETHHIYMAPGNVQWICNILFNTERMYDDFINDPPEWAKDLAGDVYKRQGCYSNAIAEPVQRIDSLCGISGSNGHRAGVDKILSEG